MKYIISLILIACLSSCKRNEDSPKPSQLSGFRPASCGDATGEGVFEAYSDSEKVRMITAFHQINDERQDTGFTGNISVSRSRIDTGQTYFSYFAKRAMMCRFFVSPSGYSLQLNEVKNTDSNKLQTVNISNYFSRGTGGNCKRLYYVFSEIIKEGSATKYRVVNKGHFDFSIQ